MKAVTYLLPPLLLCLAACTTRALPSAEPEGCDVRSDYACFRLIPDASLAVETGPDFLTFAVSIADELSFFVYEGFAPQGFRQEQLMGLGVGEMVEEQSECDRPNRRLIKTAEEGNIAFFLDVQMTCAFAHSDQLDTYFEPLPRP